MAMISDRFLLELRQARAIAILRTFRTELAAEAMTAALRGGFKVIEFTLNTPGAPEPSSRIGRCTRRKGLLRYGA
jgi:2-keto-3-deoxy-6-phosphogluconate aldolase